MHVDRMFGPAAPEHGWVPAPRYLMRRARILAMSRDLKPGEALEVGCGAGMLLQEFARRGFTCTAFESSAQALRLAQVLASEAGVTIAFADTPQPDWHRRFEIVMAFEVLEHIEDDRAALMAWASWLRPDGLLLLSVPAHARYWSAGDEWAGHYRRYERAELIRLLRGAGLEVEHIECYGYPITNLGERLSARSYARRLRGGMHEIADRRASTDRSGIERGVHVKMYPLLRSPLGRMGLAACLAVQRLFLSTDLGTGYLLRARPA